MKIFTLKPRIIICSLVALLMLSSHSFAQNERQNNLPLMFKTGMVDTDANLETFISQSFVDITEIFSDRYYRIFQFNSLPTNADKKTLAELGFQLMDYIPSKAYYVAIDKNADLSVLRNYNIKSVLNIENRFKLNKTLANGELPAHALQGSDQIQLVLRAQKNLSTYEFRQALSEQGIEVLANYRTNNTCLVIAPVSKINEIASLPFISYLEPVAPEPTPDDQEGRSLHRSSAINTQDPLGRQFDGNGVFIALADDGEVGPHIDFTGRLTNFDVGLGGGHGDMTAGIAVGAGNLDPRNAGMATGAYIYIYDISPYEHIRGADTNFTNLGSTITSTSYSQGCNEYTTDTELGDQMIHDNPHLMHVFSAGNNGGGNCQYGAGAGWGNITGGFKQGKNVIATANLNYLDALVNSSSRGPSEDGRVKPDLAANGGSQTSTDEFNTYQTGGGTSAACPGIAGTLAQLTQAYKEMNSGNLPETALLKACLQNTAEDLGNPGPDFEFGYGRINGLRALQILENNRYFTDTIDQGGSHSYNITVPAGMRELRVLIHWSDPGGNPNALTSLVNDLNMQVSDSSNSWNPWVLDPTPTVAAITSHAVRDVDSLNNTEQVTLINPTAGDYTINVSGYNVAEGPQRYWLVYEWRDATPVVTFPAGGEGFSPGQTEAIRWDAAPEVGSFSVEYSIDNGGSWNLITNSVPANQLYYEWNVPAVQTGDALVRVSRNAMSGVSEKFSIVEIPSGLLVSFACPDSIGLSWDAVPGVDGYEVSRLGTMYMDSIGYTTNTEITVYNTHPLVDYWFSVRSIGPGDIRGERANAINKGPGIFNCILPNDVAILNILSPYSGQIQDCQPISSDITIEFINVGALSQDSFPVSFSVNGGPPVSEMYVGPLAPQASDQYTFTTTSSVSGPGNYNIKAWIGLVADANVYNDSTESNTTIISATVSGPTLLEDFESSALCNNTSNCEGTSCLIMNGWINETNGEHDDIDWRVVNGYTFSNGTGPNNGMDHNPGTSTGHYIYTEATACFNRQANLVSPCIDLTGTTQPRLTFWYSMRGGAMGDLHLDIMADGLWIENIIPAFSGPQNLAWSEAVADLSPWIGKVVNLRFRGITGPGFSSDICLDDIRVNDLTDINQQAGSDPTIAIYPNPSDGFFNLNAYSIHSSSLQINIYDMKGSVVYSSSEGAVRGNFNKVIDLGVFSKGIYQIEVQTDAEIFREKLTLQ